MGQMTVFSGPERRQRWSEGERLRILSEAFAPGACRQMLTADMASSVARAASLRLC